ncbi:MAG: hypothetical protein WKG01_03520 [Kofleriaceae bacterium]
MTVAARAKPPIGALESRVLARKAELIAEIIEYKKGSRLDATDAIEKLKGQLAELAYLVKPTDQWATLAESTKRDLEQWVSQ